MTLENLIKYILKEDLYCNECYYNKDTDSLCYKINGFAKSGEATLFTGSDNKIHMQTRYGRDKIINSIEDFLDEGYYWDSHYCVKSDSIYNVYGISDEWKKIYIKYGYDISNLK